MSILDGAVLSVEVFGEPRDPRAYLLGFYPKAPVPPMDHLVATARPMIARINHGLWIASCECGARGVPAPGCVVWLDQPWGWCLRCQNGGTGRGWRPIDLPPADLRADIEEMLIFRPNVADRNWEPAESIDDLIRQNLDHGDPISEAA